MPLDPGTRLGPYEIISALGAGGMGEVYRAKDTRLGRDVAIKVLPPETSSDPLRRQRFDREAKIISGLNHPNICVLHDVGHENGIDYLVMECVEGETLSRRIARSSIPFPQLLDIAIQIADALDQAHRKGITHRDLKPGNIMLTAEGRVKVLDFGLAKQLAQPESGSGPAEDPTLDFITERGTPVGTYAYMSPEQALGHEIEPRSDLFSFGIILYEMAVRKRPFEGKSSVEICDAILHSDPAPPRQSNPALPEKFADIIHKALEKDPSLRYQSAAEIGADLRRLQRDSSSSSARLSPQQAPSQSPARAKLAYRLVASGIVLLVLLGIGYALHRASETNNGGGAPQIHSLAVLPLKNLSADPNQEYFADGTTLDLITTLTKISNLSVISWTSVRGYKNTTKTLPQIARELNADAVIDGSVERSGNHVKITIELIQAQNDRSLWAQSYDRELSDILRLQEEVAGTIAAEVRVALTPQDRARLSGTRTVDPQAYLLYTRGRALLQHWSPDTWRPARECFQQAIEKDPNYALAYAGLAESYITGDTTLDPKVTVPLARAAAMKALELDDTVSDAHVAVAQLKYWQDWDWAGSEKEFLRAFELNPGDTLAHHLYSHLLLTTGRNDEGLKESELYVRLDPVSAAAYDHLGFVYLALGQYEAAIEAYRKPPVLDPNWNSSYDWLGDAYRHQGMNQEALESYERGMQVKKISPDVVKVLRQAFEKGGWKSYWGERVRVVRRNSGHEYVSPYSVALLYARMGDKESALRHLNMAFAQHDEALVGIKLDRDFDPLQFDPAFEEILRKMNLPPSAKSAASQAR